MIAINSQGEEVKQWQAYLASLKYNVTVDGIFGPGTQQATIEFQKWCKIDADGIVGENSYAYAKANGYEGSYTA
ncbi:MAG: peptidoglycan-binding protein [Bacteroidetes bacterium]|nr:MAG: peptidoglycan-binding protein [Bacteroidota bacterium]TAG92321.1 MAG: peptidoglycan-binding protein [Bacteroidota bacterium]